MLRASRASTKDDRQSSWRETSVNFGIAISARASTTMKSHQTRPAGVGGVGGEFRAIRDRSECAR